MRTDTLDKELYDTESYINFGDDKYACYFDEFRNRCYYEVNGEFLLIIDPGKINEVKTAFKKKKIRLYVSLGAAAIVTGLALFAISKYVLKRYRYTI
jgi:hypothetical protein